MSETERTAKAKAIRQLMETEGPSVAQNTRGFNRGRYESIGRLADAGALKEKARAIKEDAIERLPELVEKVRAAVEARGGAVYLAADASEANRYITEVAHGARRVAKSKSMTSEEIEVNEHLEAEGISVVETDLGEWVLQVAEETPSHIVAPAIHKSREDIARLFNRRFEPDEPLESAEELTRFAREKLWSQIRSADVGMTGANFITADTGSIALVTSEGNARKSVLMPPTYIAVAGLEKIVPTVEDLQPFLELIGRSGTGQDITSYVSLFTPPFDTPVPDLDGRERPPEHRDRSFHLVLLDNGRRALREDSQLKETLYCIRCGACSNVCANFQEVGGHAFGGETYSGGIATGWEAGIHGLGSAASFNDLCTGCSRCVPACPVGIDIPWINVVVRDRINRGTDPGRFEGLVGGLVPDAETDNVPLARRAVAHFETLALWGSRTAPLSNWVARRSFVRWIMERTLGIDARRPLPEFARETFRQWFDRRDVGTRDADVVLFPDVHTNYVRPSRGKAAVRVLDALGLSVAVAPVSDSGRAALSQGMVATATENAQAVADALAPHVDAGRTVVFVEPSDLAMARREYGKLLPDAQAERLADASRDIMEVVLHHLEEGGSSELLSTGEGQRLTYHSHCQQRTLGLETPTVEVLERSGFRVETTTAECCGMAGSFGYKTEYYELSTKVGQTLKDEIASREAVSVVASGVSCQEQLEVLLDTRIPHPIQVIDPANC